MKGIDNILFFVIGILVGILVGLNIFNQYDVNHDGKVTATDYVLIRKYIMERGDNSGR